MRIWIKYYVTCEIDLSELFLSKFKFKGQIVNVPTNVQADGLFAVFV